MSLSSSNKKEYQSPFFIEKLRSELAKAGELEDLLRTYSDNLPEIKNKNTPILWDELNKRQELKHNRNFMEEDKLDWVAKSIPDGKKRVLNIGFGSGNLEALVLREHEKFYKWEGIDISARSATELQRRFKSSKFRKGDITRVNLTKKYYDLVIALEVLEHIPPSQILKVLKMIHSSLKSHGLFILSIPLSEDLEKMIKENTNYNEHVRMYTPELIKAELSFSGFHIVKYKFIYAFRNFYHIKTLIVTKLLLNYRSPNGIIIIAKKK